MNVPATLKTAWRQLWAWLWAWLMRNPLLVLAAALLLLFFMVALSGKKSQDVKETAEQAVTQGQLSNRQVKKTEKVLEAKNDTIKQQAAIIHTAKHKADSLVVVAKKHDARADSLIKRITHEAPTDPDAAPERVAQLLTDYTPKAWAIGQDSLR